MSGGLRCISQRISKTSKMARRSCETGHHGNAIASFIDPSDAAQAEAAHRRLPLLMLNCSTISMSPHVGFVLDDGIRQTGHHQRRGDTGANRFDRRQSAGFHRIRLLLRYAQTSVFRITRDGYASDPRSNADFLRYRLYGYRYPAHDRPGDRPANGKIGILLRRLAPPSPSSPRLASSLSAQVGRSESATPLSTMQDR